MSKVLALYGYGGVGKDTLASLLKLQHGYHRIAFANQVRELAKAVNPRVIEDADGKSIHLNEVVYELGWDLAKRMFPEVRKLLQDLGEGARTVIDQDVWLTQPLKIANNREKVVITDLRYPNELKALVDAHSHVVSVHVIREGVGPVNQHISEKAADWVPDIVIDLSECSLEGMPKVAAELVDRAERHWRDRANQIEKESALKVAAKVMGTNYSPGAVAAMASAQRGAWKHLSGEQ
ncbi:hypothetical protein FDA94_29005 [Herbidospora galbida]|uniref:Uncharacterized protein n=1 Tax=Herbidospora galbida TaxID=2575442 RepID=A0A4U3MAP8_9ACTN|nr:hypothetical protein [Herbidospora galbida]TKK84656.1 hypothetical protein FDA94_29005 [Herbidospora galbida]